MGTNAEQLTFASKTVGLGTIYLGTTVIGAALLILYLKWHWSRRKLYMGAAKLKGPFPWPFIGSALRFAGNNEDILNAVTTLYDDHESPVPIWLGHRLFFGCDKPEDLEVLLNSPKSMEKEELYKFVQPYMGHGLFSAPVSTWKIHRKVIAPTFNQKILDSFVVMMSENAKIFVQVVREDLKKATDGNIDIYDRVSRCTLDTICETAMGHKLNSQHSDNDTGKAVERAMHIIFQRMFKVWFHFDFIFNMTKLAKEEQIIIQKVHGLANQVIQTKKREIAQKQREMREHPEAEIEPDTGRKVFLDYLLEQTNFSDDELRDETITFLVTGSDTSGTIDSFIFTCLGINQDVQQKVYDEVMDVIGPERDVEVDDLQHMKYLERVIKETVRFFPIGPNIVRRIEEDLQVSNNVVLPGGSSAVLSVFAMHHNEKYWPDPWKFDPDRFLPEVAATRHPYAYLPFSAGPRNCIGMKYAFMALKTVIATTVRAFRIESDYKNMKEVRCQQDVIVKPVLGYKVRIYER